MKSLAVHPGGDRRNSDASEYKEYQSTFGDVSAMDHFGKNRRDTRNGSFISASRISIASLAPENHLLDLSKRFSRDARGKGLGISGFSGRESRRDSMLSGATPFPALQEQRQTDEQSSSGSSSSDSSYEERAYAAQSKATGAFGAKGSTMQGKTQ